MQNFDLIVIGGGPAGYTAAQRAAAAGLATLLFECAALGGVCLNEGCIPSKTLLQSAKIYGWATGGARYGVSVEGAALSHEKVMQRKNKVVRKLVLGVKAQLERRGVTVLAQRAAIAGREGAGFVVEAEGLRYSAKYLLLASGGAPLLPPLPGLQEALAEGRALTSREALCLPRPPATLAVVGGGAVGLEMAAYYAAAGSAVTVVEMLPRIGGAIDAELADILLGNLQKQGIAFHTGSAVSEIKPGGLRFACPQGEAAIEAEKVLIAVGRRPALEGLGLEALGVATEKGAVLTDEHMQTNLPGLYAAGDVNGKSMLAHTAYREAEVAVAHMLAVPDAMRYGAIPSVIYTSPEVACAGHTEESAAQSGIRAAVAKLPLAYAGRYVAEVEAGDGFCKLIADRRAGVLVGAHIIGPYASEIIYGAAAMIDAALPIEALKKWVFPHPTVSEILREALFELA